MTLFEGFEERFVDAGEVAIHARVGGSGPPLLLLHGYPQTSAMWHAVAPRLAQEFTVVCPDLRGYGRSDKPRGDADHAIYSKRSMARDAVAVMQALGFERFAVAGHDRGGRVTHRLCLDAPDAVSRAAVLDIVPTRTIFEATDQAIATGYYHWFFLAQPEPLPERLIGGDPDFYLTSNLARWSAGRLDHFDREAVAEYRAAFADPATIHATCEDYRAAATVDLEHDRADEHARIGCPLLVLWGRKGLMHANFDVLGTWQAKASGAVAGEPLDSGHFLAEERPDETYTLLRSFFAA